MLVNDSTRGYGIFIENILGEVRRNRGANKLIDTEFDV